MLAALATPAQVRIHVAFRSTVAESKTSDGEQQHLDVSSQVMANQQPSCSATGGQEVQEKDLPLPKKRFNK